MQTPTDGPLTITKFDSFGPYGNTVVVYIKLAVMRREVRGLETRPRRAGWPPAGRGSWVSPSLSSRAGGWDEEQLAIENEERNT